MEENPYKAPRTNTTGIPSRWRLQVLMRLFIYIPFGLLGSIFLVFCLWKLIQRPHAPDALQVLAAALLWTGGAVWLIRRAIRDRRDSGNQA
jgi:hypothetical protein